jgi:hypothetical protein
MSYSNVLNASGVVAQQYLPLSYGQATLVAGTVAVALPAIGANDVVLVQHLGATAVTDGVLSVAVNAGVGFTVTSTNAGDVGVLKWVRIAVA